MRVRRFTILKVGSCVLGVALGAAYASAHTREALHERLQQLRARVMLIEGVARQAERAFFGDADEAGNGDLRAALYEIAHMAAKKDGP